MSAKDEAFIRAGLAKSAFRESIYEGLPWQYYMGLHHYYPKNVETHGQGVAEGLSGP